MKKQLQHKIKIIIVFISFPFFSIAQLVNPNATSEALKLKIFLDSIYGKKIISGQMDESYLTYINITTGGKLPAIMGYDFNGICPSQGGNTDAQKAVNWVKNRKGIAQFNWHWISPDANGDWSSKNFKLGEALADTNSSSYKNLIRDMDLVAAELLVMQDSGISVLWRPLHEAEGAWFWWGMSGGDACKELYRLMYDRYVNHFGINNLIWVWNSYGTTKPNWYPGDDVVDIIAYDYPDYSVTGSWSQYQQMFGGKNKPFGVGEDGALTNPELLETQPWLYFLTWAYMVKDPSQKDGKNPKDWLMQVYNDPRVLTLDDLNEGPKACAGYSEKVYDVDDNGKELVTLDGSLSISESDSIVSYQWLENESEIATGITAQVELSIGTHKIQLIILTLSGQTKSAWVIKKVNRVSLSLNKTVKVSSTEAGGNTAEKAVDGDISTRWSSAYSDPQWYEIDLEKAYNIENIVIHWEDASAKKYKIEESNNQTDWIPVITKSNMPKGARTDSLKNLAGGARYLRIYGLNRNTTYGYSIFELEIFGVENPNAEPVEEITSVILENENSNLEIYPNSIKKNEWITLKTSADLIGKEALIYDTKGNIITHFTISENQTTILINNDYSSGMYYATFNTLNKFISTKFIVQ